MASYVYRNVEMGRIFKYALVAICLLAATSVGLAQAKKVVFSDKITDMETGGKMSGVTVELYQDGSLFKTTTSSSNGRYKLEGPIGHVYQVKFKKGGYVTKTVEVAMTNVHEEDALREFTIEMPIELFTDHPDVDFSPIENKPIGKLYFDPSSGDVNFDNKYNGKVAKEVEKLLALKDKAEEEAKGKEEEMERQYKELVSQGDAAMGSKDYDQAIQKYEAAKQIKDDGTLPPKIAKAKQALEAAKAEQAKDAEYNKLMAEAKQALDEKDYAFAKSKYQEAGKVKPDEPEPPIKIKEIEKLIADQMAQEQAFNEYMAKGDKAFLGHEYDNAITNFKEALKIKPNDPDATQRLKEAEEAKSKADAAEEAAKEKQANYDRLVKEADKHFADEEWEVAKGKYEQALSLFEDEEHPKNQIAAIERKLEEMAAADEAEKQKRAEYEKLIGEADGLFGSEKWQEAKGKYEEALGLFPDESHPQERLSAIEQKLKELADAEAAEQAKRAEYDKVVAAADDLYHKEKWEEAKGKYEEALAIIPDEEHPQTRIGEIDAKLKALADAEQAEQEKRAQYEQLISEADGLYDGEDWENAKGKYNEALGLYADEPHPQERIKAIDQKLGELADAEAAEQAKRAQYDGLIKEADGLFGSEKWEEAKGKYNEALALYADESHPQERIKAIDQKLSELADAEAAEQAKRAQYEQLISEADGLYDGEDWENAKGKYQEALALYPDENHPQTRINDIDGKLAAQMEAAERDAKYQALIEEADGMFDAEQYEEAKAKYNEAYAVKQETYPQEQLDKINEKLSELASKEQAKKEYDKIIGIADQKFNEGAYDEAKGLYNRAKNFQPNETYPDEQIVKIDEAMAQQQEQEDKYNAFIAEADQAYDSKDYEAAKGAYQQALGIFDREHPKTRLADIEQKILAMQSEAEAAAAAKAKREQYDGLIREGDEGFGIEDWSLAKGKYEEALGLFPDEAYPKAQLQKIDGKLQEQNKLQRYNELITKADEEFNGEKYEIAKETYKQAYAIVEGPYPQEQIDRINEILSEKAGAEQAKKEYDKIIRIADQKFNEGAYDEARGLYNRAKNYQPDETYPDEQIGKINEKLAADQAKEAQYNQLIAEGDKAFRKNSFDEAKAAYNGAIQVFDRDYPRSQLKAIEDKIREQQSAEEAKLAEKEKRERYQALVDEADQLFADKSLEQAKDKYKEAYEILPNDYPQEQVDKINAILMAQTRAEEGNKMYDRIIQTADENFNENNLKEARELYARAGKLKPSDGYPPQQIMKIDQMLKKQANEAKQGEVDARYNELISKADGLYNSNQLKEAKDVYKQAYGVKPERYPQDQINKINEQLQSESQEQLNRMYDKIIEQANKDYNGENWESALEYYKRANKLKPNDPFPVARIREIKDIMNGTKEVYYGEESDISLMDGQALIRKHQERKHNNKVDTVYTAYDEHSETVETYQDESTEKIMTTAEKWDKFMEEVYEEMAHDQDAIWDNVMRAKGFTDAEIDRLKESGVLNKDHIQSNLKHAKEVEDFRREYLTAKDDNRIENVDKAEAINDVQATWFDETVDEQVDNTMSNRELALKIEEFRRDYLTAKDGNRIENVDKAEAFNDVLNAWVEGSSDDQVDNTMSNRELALKIEEFRREHLTAKDDNRLENVTRAEALNDVQNAWVDGESDGQVENTFKNEKWAKEIEEFRRDYMTDKNGNYVENFDRSEEIREGQVAWKEGASDEQVENTFRNKELAKQNEDYKREHEQAKDENRLENVDRAEQLEERVIDGVDQRGDNQLDRIRNNEDFLEDALYRKPETYTNEFRNELARKYPEGVTPFKYVKKDENGDVYEVVVRRIVVLGNTGNDYVMITNSFGRTFYKNGLPIAEYTWRNETTGHK